MPKNIQDKTNYKEYLKKLKRTEFLLSFLCIAGILVCLYALQVETIKLKDSTYVAFCDVEGFMSCSKVFLSKYGKGFGLMPENSLLNLPNSIYGLIFYIIQLLLLLFRNNSKALKLKLFLSLMANFGSVYLAAILYFVLKDFCIVCASLYLINGLILFTNYNHYKYFKQINQLVNKKNN